MEIGGGSRTGPMAGVLAMTLAAILLCICAPGSASAQSIFDFLFGGAQRMAPPPLSGRAYATPDSARTSPDGVAPEQRSGGRTVAFCVRLCDGFNFPIERHAAAAPVGLCTAMCPASRTKIFSGSEITRAAAADGTRYSDIDNAFVYRERLVANCTCNGRDAFGLAPVSLATDPTLRPGDVVTTASGLMAFTPAKFPRAGVEAANFTPIDSYSGLSDDLRRRLATTRIAPPAE